MPRSQTGRASALARRRQSGSREFVRRLKLVGETETRGFRPLFSQVKAVTPLEARASELTHVDSEVHPCSGVRDPAKTGCVRRSRLRLGEERFKARSE